MGLALASALSSRFHSAVQDVIFSVCIFLRVLSVIPLGNSELFDYESSLGCCRGCCGRECIYFLQERHEHVIDFVLLLLDVTKLIVE